MSKGRKTATRRPAAKEGRLSGQYKRAVVRDLVGYLEERYPALSKGQVRRIFNYAYQTMREGR